MSRLFGNTSNRRISRLAATAQANRSRRLGKKLRTERLELREMLSVNWADTFGSTGTDWPTDLAIAHDGGVYVSGEFGNGTTIDFDDQNSGGELTSEAAVDYGTDGFLVKYDQYGGFQWAVHAANDERVQISGVAVDSQDNTYIVGIFTNYVDFYVNGVVQQSISETANCADLETFIAKVSSTGEVEWAEALGGAGTQGWCGIELLENIATGDVDLFVHGGTVGGGDLDPGPSETLAEAKRTDRHGYLAKYHYDVSSGLQLDWFTSAQDWCCRRLDL